MAKEIREQRVVLFFFEKVVLNNCSLICKMKKEKARDYEYKFI